MDTNIEEFLEIAEASLWKYNFKDDTLSTILKNYTKQELTYLKDCVGIEAGSNLKKADLYQRILEDLVESLPETLHFFNENHMNFLNLFLNAENYIIYNPLLMELPTIQFMNSIGLVYPLLVNDEKVIVMPIEIKQLMHGLLRDHYQAVIDQNTSIIKLLYGYANLYGAYDFDELEPFNQMDEEQLFNIQYVIKYDNFVTYRLEVEETYVYQLILEDSLDDFLNEVDDDLDYFPFTTEEVLNASHFDYIEENEYTTKIKNLVKYEYGLDEDAVKIFTVTVMNYLKMGFKASEIIDLIEDDNDEQLPYNFKTKLIQILKVLEKTTRKWTLRGHREMDLNQDQVHSKFIKFNPKR